MNYKGSLLAEAQEMADNVHITPLFWLSVTQAASERVNSIVTRINGTSYSSTLITISLKSKISFIILSVLNRFLLIIKEAIRGLTMTV